MELASQLYLTERKKGESMQYFIYCLKHLNSRCQPHERFRDNQLLARFINGMNHKDLYINMITQGITTWEDTIIAVIQLKDNIKMHKSINLPSEASRTKFVKSVVPSIEKIVALYLQKMGYANRNELHRELACELAIYSNFHGYHPNERVSHTPPSVYTIWISRQEARLQQKKIIDPILHVRKLQEKLALFVSQQHQALIAM